MAYEEIVQQLEFLRDIGIDRLDLRRSSVAAVQAVVEAPLEDVFDECRQGLVHVRQPALHEVAKMLRTAGVLIEIPTT